MALSYVFQVVVFFLGGGELNLNYSLNIPGPPKLRFGTLDPPKKYDLQTPFTSEGMTGCLPGKPRKVQFFRQRDVAGFRGFKVRVKLTSQLVFQVGTKPTQLLLATIFLLGVWGKDTTKAPSFARQLLQICLS